MSQTHARYIVLEKGSALSKEQLNISEGDLARARAGVGLARAQVDQDRTMLSKATIYSPIDGVVLDRKVERRPDRGRRDDDAGAVHARERSRPDGAGRRYRRGRCRPDPCRRQGELHGRCLSDAQIRRQADLDPQRAQDRAGRRDLSGRAAGAERGRPAQARHDRDRRNRSRQCEERARWSPNAALRFVPPDDDQEHRAARAADA